MQRKSQEIQSMSNDVSIYLSTGHQFKGKLIGAPSVSSGEIVFTTGMVGYSEAISDPSYLGQVLVFTYPLVGNYGVPLDISDDGKLVDGLESKRIYLSAVILQEDFSFPSHHILGISLSKWLEVHGIPGITGVDTRQITQIVRDHGKVFAKIIPDSPKGALHRTKLNYIEKSDLIDEYFDPSMQNILPEASVEKVIEIGRGKKLINLVDCGVKWSIVRELLKRDCTVRLLPWNSNLQSFAKCDGWVFSNGPGDPSLAGELIQNIKVLLTENKPILGICLGHQLIALAAGASTYRLPYGHRSQNQPVREVGTMKGYITSQNHGYAVDRESIPVEWNVWFENVNDESVEGMKHKTLPFFTAQFHPEASSGPNDTKFIFDDFINELKN